MDNMCRIVLYLAKKQTSFTLRELSRTLKIPYATFYRTVQRMDELVHIDIKGRTKLISIRWNELTRSYLTIASHQEKKEFLRKQQVFRVIDRKAQEITLVFGSYASGKESQKSDIDLMILNEQGNKTIDFSDIELLYDVRINPVFFSKKEFLELLQDKEENVGKQAVNNHVLLSEGAVFWSLVEEGIYEKPLRTTIQTTL